MGGRQREEMEVRGRGQDWREGVKGGVEGQIEKWVEDGGVIRSGLKE